MQKKAMPDLQRYPVNPWLFNVNQFNKDLCEKFLYISCIAVNPSVSCVLCERGDEGQTQQFLVRATFTSFSRPSHIEILFLRLLCALKFLIHKDKTIFYYLLSWRFRHVKEIILHDKAFKMNWMRKWGKCGSD